MGTMLTSNAQCRIDSYNYFRSPAYNAADAQCGRVIPNVPRSDNIYTCNLFRELIHSTIQDLFDFYSTRGIILMDVHVFNFTTELIVFTQVCEKGNQIHMFRVGSQLVH